MRLASFKLNGIDCLGVEMDGQLYGLSAWLKEPADMIDLIKRGPALLEEIAGALRAGALTPVAAASVTWQPPVRTPSKIVCIALNNRSLDAIKIKAPTDHPAFFLKPQTALAGHLGKVRIKPEFGFTHPEPELGVIIGRELRDATPADALAGVFGYTIVNDITCVGMRDEDSFALRYFRPDVASGNLVEDVAYTSYPGRYKASDTFAPMGPYIVTSDEIPDPAGLTISCWMDDRLVAQDRTKNYVWSVADALSHVSRTMTLLPGDIVSMGTAVGGDQDDPNAPHIPGVTRCDLNGFGGVVTVEISDIGTLSNTVVATTSELA